MRRVMFLTLVALLAFPLICSAAAPSAGDVDRLLSQNLAMGDALNGRPANADTAGMLERFVSQGLAGARALVAADPQNAQAQDLLGLFLTAAYYPVYASAGTTLRRGVADPAGLKEGLDALQKAATLAPQVAGYRLDYAQALIRAGQPEAARPHLSELASHMNTLSRADRSRLQQLQDQVGAAVAPAHPTPPTPRAEAGLTWMSYDDALAQAKRENKQVLVDFMAQWCGWCKRLDADTFSNARVQALSQKYVFARVDTDKQPQISQRYHVTGFPTVVSLRADGTEVTRSVGYKGPQDFLRTFQ
jgi:thiol-disulfide isomerase/thioredoxin